MPFSRRAFLPCFQTNDPEGRSLPEAPGNRPLRTAERATTQFEGAICPRISPDWWFGVCTLT
jgi:hypothetical protein